MNLRDLKKARALIAKAKKLTNGVANLRDEISNTRDDLTDLLQSVEGGCSGLENAMCELDIAIDKLSELV